MYSAIYTRCFDAGIQDVAGLAKELLSVPGKADYAALARLVDQYQTMNKKEKQGVKNKIYDMLAHFFMIAVLFKPNAVQGMFDIIETVAISV